VEGTHPEEFEMKRERTRRWTNHTTQRMSQRGIGPDVVETAQDYGRVVHTRGAVTYAIGRTEIAFYAAKGINLGRLNGVQVICCPTSGAVITVYRNRNFRHLRPNLGRKSSMSNRHNRIARYPGLLIG